MNDKKMISRIRFRKKFLGIIESGYTDLSLTSNGVYVSSWEGILNKSREIADIQFPQLCGMYAAEGKLNLIYLLLGVVVFIAGLIIFFVDINFALLGILAVIVGIFLILLALVRETKVSFTTAGMVIGVSGYASYTALLSLLEQAKRNQELYLEKFGSSPPKSIAKIKDEQVQY